MHTRGKLASLLYALYRSARQRVDEFRGAIKITMPTTTKSSLPPREIQYQRHLARTKESKMHGYQTETGAPIPFPNLTFLQTVNMPGITAGRRRRGRRGRSVSSSSIVFVLIVLFSLMWVVVISVRKIKERTYDQRPPFRNYEYFAFAKQMMENVVQEMIAQMPRQEKTQPSTAKDHAKQREQTKLLIQQWKTRIVSMYDYEHGGKLCEIIFDLYGSELVDIISQNATNADTQETFGEVYSAVDLFRIAAAYKSWLLEADDVRQREKRTLLRQQTEYQVCTGRVQQWWWMYFQKPLYESYITSPLMNMDKTE